MKLKIQQHNLELKHPFTIARWTYTHTPSMVVTLTHHGHTGYGEATHNPYYPNTEIDYMTHRLEQIQDIIESHADTRPEAFWTLMHALLADCPFAMCALDEAYHDLYTKQLQIPLYEYWGLQTQRRTPNCYTLSIDTFDLMIERMKANPWDIYKIKLGTDRDIDMVEAIRQHTKATFWVDANCAWNVDDAIRKSIELKKLGVTLIEQPLAADQWEAMEEVYHKSVLPLMADESCKTLSDIEKCDGTFHGINIKVMKCGGLIPAKQMIEEARSRDLKVMVGCMAESTVGISAIAHLAPLIDFADMDGQHFVKNDPAKGVLVQSKGITYANTPGTGVRLL